MATNVLLQIVELIAAFIGGFLVNLMLLRFLLQAMRAPFRNSLSKFVAALTDWAVLPARRVIPGIRGIDLSPLLLAWVIQFALLLLLVAVRGGAQMMLDAGPLAQLAFAAALKLVNNVIWIFIIVIVVQAVLSWINPDSPVAPLLYTLSEPLLRPFRRLIPPIANIDLSPLFALLALNIALIPINALLN